MVSEFKFRHGMRIGATNAEEDSKFLHNCFVDTGLIERLRNVEDPECMLIGRTGAGKTALSNQLMTQESDYIEIDAETLSFNYIANSEILRFFSNIGVNLDLFFRLLWQHILTVEILRYRYQISDSSGQQRFLETIKDAIFRDRRKKTAIDYLQKYGDNFWLESGVRAREITTKFEEELQGEVGVGNEIINASLSGKDVLSVEEKQDIVYRAQKVVNNVQMRELSKVIDFLDEDVFRDKKNRFYIIIDKIDENWVGDIVRYKLIRSLLECIRKFRHVTALKIILAIRSDLLDRVIFETKNLGFQSEKYEDFYLRLRWTQNTLVKLMDLRVNDLIKSSYTKKPVGLNSIFPSKIGNETIQNYIVQRTFLRPRDAIVFVNTVLERAADKVEISATLVREAETAYSRGRLKNLSEEWSSVHPTLDKALKLLTRWRNGMLFHEIPSKVIHDLALDIAAKNELIHDELFESANSLVDRGGDGHQSFARNVLCVLYKVGVIGVKTQTHRPTIWSESDEESLTSAEILDDSRIYVHKALHSALGVIIP